MKKYDNEWIHYDEIDLLSAKKLLEDENLTTSAAFHCHQAIEKSFKVAWHHKSKKPLHDI